MALSRSDLVKLVSGLKRKGFDEKEIREFINELGDDYEHLFFEKILKDCKSEEISDSTLRKLILSFANHQKHAEQIEAFLLDAGFYSMETMRNKPLYFLFGTKRMIFVPDEDKPEILRKVYGIGSDSVNLVYHIWKIANGKMKMPKEILDDEEGGK